jgi:predicted ATPase with chaperone activity
VLAAVRSATLVGVDGQPVTVEVHVSQGLPAYHVVGLPDTAVRESRERVRAALLSSQLGFPMQRITVNLAPGGVRKSGSGLELAVALGLLAAADELPAGVLDAVAVLGELGLDGSVRAVPGTLALVDALARRGTRSIIVPLANAAEAALVRDVRVRAARNLVELRACLKGEAEWPSWDDLALDADDHDAPCDDEPVDLREVRGLAFARRALEVAAAGAHHLLFVGPPGTGKTMLARRLVTVLPPLEHSEALTRSRSPASTPPRARRSADASSHRDPFGHHITPRPRLPSSEAAAPGCVPARSPSRTEDCSFSTSSASSRPLRSTRSDNRWRNGSCASHDSTRRSPSRRRSSSSRARTRARVVSASRTAGAANLNARATGAG